MFPNFLFFFHMNLIFFLTLKGPASCRAKNLPLVGKRHFVKKSIFVSTREMGNIVFLKKVKNYPKWGRGGIWLQRKNVFFDFFFSKKICGRKIQNHKSIYEKEKVDFCDLAHQYNKIWICKKHRNSYLWCKKWKIVFFFFFYKKI